MGAAGSGWSNEAIKHTLFSMHWYKIGFSKVPEVSSEVSPTTDEEKATSSEHTEHLNLEDDKGREEIH
ncbi:unnamed protein product [Penicillium discolor]